MNTIIIETKLGKIIGLNKQIESTKISTFLGIPYAEAPLDKLRFKAPKTKNKWKGQLEAIHWPNPCMQPDQFLQLYNQNFSEDCLYLNIWSPLFGNQNSKKNFKPVVVIIHTGAFIFGSASETKYNGIFLSYHADVVVVTFNYRLNFYGFFYSPNHTDHVIPNLGMLDQVTALKWVNEHIERFGGDPNRITIIGQSSAALSAGMHVTSPLSQNLFHQAILMSGSPLQMIESNEPHKVYTFWSNYIRFLNCQNFIPIKDIINCVDSKIKLNRNSLISMKLVKQLSTDKLFVNIPIVIDGYFQPQNQLELLDRLKYQPKTNLSILYGYTNDEGSWISMLEDPLKFGPHIQSYLSSHQALKTAEVFLDKMYTIKSINKTKILDYYLNHLLNIQQETFNYSNDSVQMKIILHRLVSNILGDRYIICPMEFFVDLILKDNETTTMLYQYYWQYKGNHRTSAFWNTFSRVWCGQWMGSCHSFEMFAVFGIPFLEPSLFDHFDRMISIETIQMIKYFVLNGKLFWPPFKDNEKLFYNVDYHRKKFIFGNNFKSFECNQFWNI